MVRQFALEKLGKARAESELRAAQYLLHFAREYESDFHRLDEEKGNLFAILDWAEAQEEHHRTATELADLLSTFMYRRGLWVERVGRLRRALEIAELIGEKEDTVRLCYLLGNAYRNQGDDDKARNLIENGLALGRELGLVGQVGVGLFLLAELAFRAEDYPRARELGAQALRLIEQAEATDQLPQVLSLLGACEKEIGNPEAARTFYEEGQALARLLEDTSLVGILLEDLCRLDIHIRDFERAKERAREFEEFANQAGDPLLEGTRLLIWGTLFWATSHPEEAMSHSLAAVSHFEEAAMPMKAEEAREGVVLVATTELNDLLLAEEQLRAIASTLSDLGNDQRAAFALYRLGLVQEGLNRPGDAKLSYEKALSLYASLGMLGDPKAEETSSRLQDLRRPLT